MGGHHHHGQGHGQGHGHAHGAGGHDHARGANARALWRALLLTGGFMGVEAAAGLWLNSLALLSDAAHMLTDTAALAIALAAIRLGARPADSRRTFGYRRLEVLAAAVNAVLLFAIALWVFWEAIGRFRTPEPVGAGWMMAVAALGLVVNLLSMRLLAAGRGESLNVRGAYLEVWADAIGSVGVLAGGLAIRLTGWRWIDPAVAVAIALWVLPRTWLLLRDTVNVLLDGVPPGIDLGEVRVALERVDGVAGVHDLHVWSSASDEVCASLHLAVAGDADAARRAAAGLLHDRFGIGHSTIQTEPAGAACATPAHA